MDWIEQLFHLSPDGGNGSTELLFALLVAAIVLVASSWITRHFFRARELRRQSLNVRQSPSILVYPKSPSSERPS